LSNSNDMIFFGSQVLTCAEYKLPKSLDNLKDSPTLEADKIKRDFFDPPTVTAICKSLISKYLPLSRDDLELWDTDPEQYGKEIIKMFMY
jgi:hypothetical protein